MTARGPLRVASWNMAHWQYSRRIPDHTARVWSYLARAGVDVALVQEAVPPPPNLGWDHRIPQGDWRIGDTRYWGSGIAAAGLPLTRVNSVVTRYSSHEFDLTAPAPHRGAVGIADAEVPGFGTITAISVYALMAPVYAQTTLLRVVADLIPLLIPRAEVAATSSSGAIERPHADARPVRTPAVSRHLRGLIESLGLVNCFRTTAAQRPKLRGCTCEEPECFHVQTRRNPRHKGTPKEHFSGHFDYLFASPELASRLVRCYAVGAEDESVWALSDHCPVVAEFDLAGESG